MRSDYAEDGQLAKDRMSPWGSSVSRSRSARRRARSWVRHRLKGWAPWFGYLYLALALAYAIDKSLTLGIVGLMFGVPITWVCGLWVLPRSEDAYALATSNVLHDWGAKIRYMQRRHSAESRRLATATLDSLPGSIPSSLRNRLGSALERKPEDTAPTREMVQARLVSSYEQRITLKAVLKQIETECHDDAPALQEAATNLLVARQSANREFLAALTEERVCLANVRPPRALVGMHDAIVQLCDEYQSAVAACFEAIEAEDGDAVRRTADEVSSIWQARRDARRVVMGILQSAAPG